MRLEHLPRTELPINASDFAVGRRLSSVRSEPVNSGKWMGLRWTATIAEEDTRKWHGRR